MGLWVLISLTSLWALQRAPVGPASVGWGDVLYGWGDVSGAVAHWDLVGRWHPRQTARLAAHLRAAEASEVRLRDRSMARRYLERAVAEDPQPRALASIWIRIAQVADRSDGAAEDAVAAWRTALSVDPEGPHAAEAREGLAMALADSGRLQAALLAWDQVLTHHPDRAGRAGIAQGALLLAADDTWGALEAYERVSRRGTPPWRQAALLGAATARARLGDHEGALRDLLAADLPDQVVRSRARALEARGAEVSDEDVDREAGGAP